MQGIKCMIIGDSQVGKTDLFSCWTTGTPASSYAPTVFDTHTMEVSAGNEKYNLGLWDSAGDKIYDEIRPISYPHTDCFIICFAVDDRESFENVEKKWKPETLRFGDGPDVPIILAALKSDLSDTTSNSVSFEEGEAMKIRIGAAGIHECSTKTMAGLDKLLTHVIEAAVLKKSKDEEPANPIWGFEDLKIVVVGDSTVGKTSIIQSYSSKKPISELHHPTSEVVPYYHDIILDGIEYFFGIYDLPSQIEFAHDRMKEYEKADGVILCYSINDPFSFQNIEQQWLPEIRACSPQVPIVLVGNKKDLANDSDVLIPTVDGEELMISIGASAFIECSAKTLDSLQDVYVAAARAFRKSNHLVNE